MSGRPQRVEGQWRRFNGVEMGRDMQICMSEAKVRNGGGGRREVEAGWELGVESWE